MTHQKVQVWIYRKTPQGMNVLILQLTPERGGFWQPVTGGVEPDEEIAHAARREAMEETGLAFKEPLLSLDYEFSFEARGAKFEEHVYALEASGEGAQKWNVRMDPREHVAYQWVTPEQALKQVKHPSNAEGLKRLLIKKGEN